MQLLTENVTRGSGDEKAVGRHDDSDLRGVGAGFGWSKIKCLLSRFRGKPAFTYLVLVARDGEK